MANCAPPIAATGENSPRCCGERNGGKQQHFEVTKCQLLCCAAAASAAVAAGVAVAALADFRLARPPLSCLVRLDAAASQRTPKKKNTRKKNRKIRRKILASIMNIINKITHGARVAN